MPISGGVRIVPEIDIPGHVNAWLAAYPEWGVKPVTQTHRFGGHRACLDPTDDAVYEALEQIFTEVTEVFSDPYVHIGGDEVNPVLVVRGSKNTDVYADPRSTRCAIFTKSLYDSHR
jgi:N-acetyl-beta-hexosaminidase